MNLFKMALGKKVFSLYYLYLMNKIPSVSEKLSGSTFVVNASRSDSEAIYNDFFVARLLAAYGGIVYFVYGNEHIKFDIAETIYCRKPIGRKIKCILHSTLFPKFSNKNLKIINRKYIDERTELSPQDLANIDIDKEVYSSISRFLEGSEGVKDLNSPEIQKIKEKIIVDCVKSIKVAKWCLNYAMPKTFITTHGIYSTWGPAYQYMRQRNIQSKILFTNVYTNKYMLSNVPAEILAAERRFRNRKKIIAKENILKAVKFLEERLEMKAVDNSVLFSRMSLIRLNDLPKKSCFLMLPNVVWDGNVKERDRAFCSLIDWVFHTIDLFLKDERKFLIIRCHPAEERIYPSSVKLEHLVEKRYSSRELPRNVRIIGSNENVDTYDLMRKATASLVYDGMPAIESAFIGTPVLLCGFGRFFGSGIGIDVESVELYDKLLCNGGEEWLEKYNLELCRENAIRVIAQYCFEENYTQPHLELLKGSMSQKEFFKWISAKEAEEFVTELAGLNAEQD